MDASLVPLVHYYYEGPTLALPLLCRPDLAPPLTQWADVFTAHGVTTWPRTTTAPEDVTCAECQYLVEVTLPPDFGEQLLAFVTRWVPEWELAAETHRTLHSLMRDLMVDWHRAHPGLTETQPRPPHRVVPFPE